MARKKKNDNGEETSGTPGYMAPEVICRMNHSYEADYFALGVIVYELIFGVVIIHIFRDLMLVIQGKKLDRRFSVIKPKLMKKIFLLDGILLVLILSIGLLRGINKVGSATMEFHR